MRPSEKFAIRLFWGRSVWRRGGIVLPGKSPSWAARLASGATSALPPPTPRRLGPLSGEPQLPSQISLSTLLTTEYSNAVVPLWDEMGNDRIRDAQELLELVHDVTRWERIKSVMCH